MSAVLDSLTLFMMIGIVVIVGISQFNRIVGSILGIAFWGLVAVIGMVGYGQGRTIGFSRDFTFSPPVFLGLCALLAGFNVLNLWVAMRRKRRPPAALDLDD